VQDVEANDNIAEGLKLDEKEGDYSAGGSLYVVLENVTSNGSAEDEGIVLEEEGGGSLIALLNNVEASHNDNDGAEITESGGGSLNVRVVDSVFNSNKKLGLKVEQGGGGHGQLALVDVVFDGFNNNEEEQWEAEGVDVTMIETGLVSCRCSPLQ
jgi:hypothetical protein